MIKSDQNPQKLRNIGSSFVSKIFVVQGIIVTASKPYLKASVLKIQCKSCNHVKNIPINSCQTPYIPRTCTASNNAQKCPLDSYVVLPTS
jgi:DNA replication licensing factor MCM5